MACAGVQFSQGNSGRSRTGSPLLYLSAYFEENRDEYYVRLRAVTEQGGALKPGHAELHHFLFDS